MTTVELTTSAQVPRRAGGASGLSALSSRVVQGVVPSLTDPKLTPSPAAQEASSPRESHSVESRPKPGKSGRHMLSRECAGAALCRWVVGLGASVLMAGIGCGAPTPRWVVPERANIELTIEVMDLDPFVVTDCQRLIAAALRRHGFQAPDAAAAKASSPLNVQVDVTFPDGTTADITGAVDITFPPQKVLASSRIGYFDLPAADLRSRGGRYRTQACSAAAERFAIALVDRLGNAPHLAVPIPEETPPMPSEPAHEEEGPR